MEPWWDRLERLRYELRMLVAEGIRYEIVSEELRSDRDFQVRVFREIDGVERQFLATFPVLYPYTRFEVVAEDLSLPHHQHPFGGNLCVFGRATENWRIGDTLARTLIERVPEVIRVGRAVDPAEVEGAEEHQAEPWSDYYGYLRGALLLVDGSWQIPPDVEHGDLLLSVAPELPLRGAVIEVRDSDGRTLQRNSDAVVALYPERVRGRWIRMQRPPHTANPAEFFQEAVRRDPRRDRVGWQALGSHRVRTYGILFREEVGWREEGEGWMFAAVEELGTRARPG